MNGTKRIATTAVLAVCFVVFSETAFAHGGKYRGPTDTVPGRLGTPGDFTPPPIPGGPTTPGGNHPGGPTTPGIGSPVTGGAPAVGPGTGGKRSAAGGEGFEQWTFWWENNKARFLNLREKVRSGGLVTGDTGYFLGRGNQQATVTTLSPTKAQIRDQVLPALRRTLRDDDFDTRAAGLIAIGKSSRDAEVLPDILRGFGDANAQVRESAGLALGLLGQEAAVPLLVEIMNDSAEGRRLTQRATGVETRTRAFAAIGLGLIGSRSAVPALREVIRHRNAFAQTDVPTAAIHALGLIGDPSVVPDLIQVLQDATISDYVRSAVPIALGKIGDRNATPILESFLKNERENDIVRWSAIIGYGRLLRGSADADAIQLLAHLLRSSNAQTRNFAAMSLAYVGGDQARTTLLGAFRQGRAEQMPWVSLSLAVWNWGSDADPTILEQVRRQFQEQRNPTWKAGHAVALGLLGDQASAPMLTRELARNADHGLQGYLCVALGLMQATESLGQLEAILKTSRSFPELQQQAAIGLGLLGNKEVGRLLIDTMAKTDSAYVLGSSAMALGLIGDRNAIEPMVKLSGNPEAKKIVRALATVGLGILCDKDSLSRLTRVAEDSNYRAKVDFMAELLTIL